MKNPLVFLLLLLLVVGAQAQTVVLTTPDGVIHRKSTTTATIKMTNDSVPWSPIVLCATATWIDWDGTEREVISDPVTIQVVQPLALSKVKVDLGSKLAFVAGSATSTVPVVAASINDVLSFSFDKTLIEGESLDIMFQFSPRK